MLSALVLGLALLLAPVARAADKPVCSAVLYDDAELLKALPPRLQPIVESARFRTMITNRDSAWSKFHSALDWGLAHEGRDFIAKIGDLGGYMRFRRTKLGKLELLIDVVAKGSARELALGKVSSGPQFLDFIAAELAWIAKARATGKLERGLTIYGRDLQNRRLVDLLASIGFKKSKWPGPQCYVYGVIGGVLGYASGRLFFAQFDANDQNGSIYEEQRKFYRDVAFGAAGGVGVAVASACFNKTGRNYSIDFDPEGIPKKTDTIPDEPTLPQTDVPSGDVIPNEPPRTEPPKADEPAPPKKDEPAPQTDVTPLPTMLPTPAPTGA